MYNDHIAHWRDSGRKAKFFMIEAQVFFPMVLTVFHFRTWTISLSVLTAILLFVLSRYNVTFWVLLINLREWTFGREKYVDIVEVDE
ncbi:IcmT/TraK family protein [Fangia hongkongensis]|uniref:IcmT/TraK family protein n=1 Tax=Fangia hongkongensis TaxID=270495 RepID=UPI000363C85B|nr:IcmT/TraK family protein [Fangia hongkongensis]MBK2124236.1 hypothetical protein [Fangia hongkongensis]